jgi:uncharacterized protein
MSFKNYLAATTLLLASAAATADFELGSKYYDQGNFEKAYKEFLEAAAYGDHYAQRNIGAMYYRGEFVAKDMAIAYAWMSLAAQEKSFQEKGTHLNIYKKLSDEQKKVADEKYKALLAEYGDQAVQARLSPKMSTTSLSVQKQRLLKSVSPKYPQDLLERGASGFVDIIFSIDKNGTTYDQMIYFTSEKGFGKAALNALRKFQYEPLKVNGKPVAANGVSIRFVFGIEGAEYNREKIKKLVDEKREKAKQGDSHEKFTFAYFLESIPAYVRDYQLVDNPNEWYTNAATEGNPAASYFLGKNILYGNMCEANPPQSMGWLMKAAKADVAEAQYLLAMESFSGARLEKNDDKGFYWLERAAVKNAFARVKYAWLLTTNPDPARRNGKLASTLLQGFDDDYVDKQSLYQAQAATAAENDNFTEAVAYQRKALEDAKKLDISVDLIEQRLSHYKDNQAWQEEI